MNSKLQAAAKAVLDSYPQADAVLVCEDGNVFLEEVANLAQNHCRQHKLPTPVRVERGGRAEAIAELNEALNNATVDLGDDSAPEEVATEEAAPEEAAPVAPKAKKKGK